MKYYKLARLDGYDFHTGNTINYRAAIGSIVKPPKADRNGDLCSSSFIHASDEPNKCFVGARIPCSAYIVEGEPISCDDAKCGFTELKVIEEISDLDKLFGWNYSEAIDPVNPFLVEEPIPLAEAIELLHSWSYIARNFVETTVYDPLRVSFGYSICTSVGDSVSASINTFVGTSVGTFVYDPLAVAIYASVGGLIYVSIYASEGTCIATSVYEPITAYIGSLFPAIKEWKYIDHKKGEYPFQACVDLWRGGYVSSYRRGGVWRLHSGKKAEIVYEKEIRNETEKQSL